MDKRTYFAANAPAMPAWFEARDRAQEPRLSDYTQVPAGSLHDELVRVFEQPEPQWGELSEFTQAWLKRYREEIDAHREWSEDRDERLFYAWRWTYADMMTTMSDD